MLFPKSPSAKTHLAAGAESSPALMDPFSPSSAGDNGIYLGEDEAAKLDAQLDELMGEHGDDDDM